MLTCGHGEITDFTFTYMLIRNSVKRHPLHDTRVITPAETTDAA